jgi:hypothetical protein
VNRCRMLLITRIPVPKGQMTDGRWQAATSGQPMSGRDVHLFEGRLWGNKLFTVRSVRQSDGWTDAWTGGSAACVLWLFTKSALLSEMKERTERSAFVSGMPLVPFCSHCARMCLVLH